MAALRPADRERGIALVIVLWVLALLVVLVLEFTGSARTELQIARNQEASARASAIADAGVTYAVLGMLDPTPATQWRADGREHVLSYGGGTIHVGVQDEGGKIDLNDAPPEMLRGLFQSLGVEADAADQIVAAILTRRKEQETSGDTGLAAQPGNPSPSPPQRPFLAVEELRLLPDVTAEIYSRVAKFLTVHGDGAQVNPVTAPAEVLRSLPGADPSSIAAFIAGRSQLVANTGALPPLPGVQGIAVAPVQTFTVTSRGLTANGATFIREAMAALTGAPDRPVQFLSWRQALGDTAPAEESPGAEQGAAAR